MTLAINILLSSPYTSFQVYYLYFFLKPPSTVVKIINNLLCQKEN